MSSKPIRLTEKNLEDMNKFLSDTDINAILLNIELKKIEQGVYLKAYELERRLHENNKCEDIIRIGKYLYGDWIYAYCNQKVRIEIICIDKIEVKINDYIYYTDNVDDLLNKLDSIHRAIEDGII